MHSPGVSRRGIERVHVFSSLKIESDVRNSASWTVSFIFAKAANNGIAFDEIQAPKP